MLNEIEASAEPLAIETAEEGLWPERSEVGRAITTTPRREMRPQMRSVRVKGWCRRMEQAKQAAMGARKVMTVASAIGR